MPDNECLLCGAPGGYPYCNEACRQADNPDEDADYARQFGDSLAWVTDPDNPPDDTDGGADGNITDPWASDARNYL